MLTPQDIREKTFEKAVFGGYDTGSVDSFMEDAANELAALHKENAVLKGKLKVLVEKVEEYRSTEDAMRLALLSAQKMSVDITDEAKEKSEAMISQAKQEADSILRNVKDEVSAEEYKLVEAKRSSAQFLEKMRLICTKQLDFFDALGEMKFDLPQSVPIAEEDEAYYSYEPEEPEEPEELGYFAEPEVEPEAALDSTVRSIEDSVARIVDTLDPEIDIEQDFESEPELLGEGEQMEFPDPSSEQTRLYSFGKDIPKSEVTPRPKFAFDNLRFGEKYDKVE